MHEKIIVKKGTKKLVIPDDYIPVHVEGTDTYYPALAASNGKAQDAKKYDSIQHKAHGPYVWTWKNEDNPVWRFRIDLRHLDIDPSTLDGASTLGSPFTFLSPFDDLNYLNNLSIVSQLINTKKGLVDIERYIARHEAMEKAINLITERIEDLDLLNEISGILAIDENTNAEHRRGRKKK